MQAKEKERRTVKRTHEQRRAELEAILNRMLGKYGKPSRPLKEVRDELEQELEGISVSRMVIEAR